NDPVTGVGTPGGMDQNITMSALAPYLGARYIDHTATGQDANTVNTKLESVYRCPSDNLWSRGKFADNPPNGGKGVSRYSYAMNYLVANPIKAAPGATGPAGTRNGWTFTGKIASIRKPSVTILLVDEDEQCVDDGYWNPNPSQWATGQVEMIASRHSMAKRM